MLRRIELLVRCIFVLTRSITLENKIFVYVIGRYCACTSGSSGFSGNISPTCTL